MEPHLWSHLAYALSITPLPKKVDVVFIHAFDNFLDELLRRAGEISKIFPGVTVVINGATSYEVGGRGVEYARKKLEAEGVSSLCIFETLPALHTNAEAQAFARFAKEHSIESAIVLTIPPHLMRAYLTSVHVFGECPARIQLVPQTILVDWDTKVEIAGLVSIPEKTSLIGRLYSECARIMKYRMLYEAGDSAYGIASIREGMLHLRPLVPEIVDRALESAL